MHLKLALITVDFNAKRQLDTLKLLSMTDARRISTSGKTGSGSDQGKLVLGLCICVRANRPLPSSKNPHFQKEARCTTFLVKISFICMTTKDFHVKGWACFETEARGNPEMAYSIWIRYLWTLIYSWIRKDNAAIHWKFPDTGFPRIKAGGDYSSKAIISNIAHWKSCPKYFVLCSH